jgi:hypothetical protein
MFCEHKGIKLESVTGGKMRKNVNTWNLNTTLLNNQRDQGRNQKAH